MIAGMLDWLKKNIIQPPTKETLAGREFLHMPNNWKEYREPVNLEVAFHDHEGGCLQLGTIEALIAFILAHGDKKCQVVIHPEKAIAYFDTDKTILHETYRETLHRIEVPFIPPVEKMEFGYIQFMDFLNQHNDTIEQYEALASAVRSFKSTNISSLTVKEKGPVITIEQAASKDVEGATTDIPKAIKIWMPTGTREFLTPNIYLLRIIPGSMQLNFTLTKKEHDGSWQYFMDLATKKLKVELPSTVLVLEGAELDT